MHITQLEIDNFKSFAKKTKIPFFEGFTVISGPNGSGKSNIVDSVLFVLALSSSRGLRAEKLTDLINLNSGRNTAEVGVTFSDGSTVRRRIKRTDNGYYSYNYLNERLCKQSDVIEHLAKFGIKPEGYNVVMQGDITRIMEMSDLERRKIIDEIAGVAEFDSKRDAALTELEVVRERIEREELLLREHAERLKELEAERVRAIEHQKLTEDLGRLKVCRGAAQLHEKEQELATIRQIMGEHQGTLAKNEAAKSAEGAKLAEEQANQQQVDGEINEKSSKEYLDLLAQLEGAKSGIKYAEQSIARLAREKEEQLEVQNRVYMDSKRAEAKVAEFTEKIRNLGIDRANLAMELAAAKAIAEKSEKDLSHHSKEIEGAKESLFRLMEQIDEQKGKRADLLHEQDGIIERSRMRTSEQDRLQVRLRQIETEIGEKNQQLAEWRNAEAACVSGKQKLDRDLSATESSLFAQRSALERISKEIKSTEQELMRLEAQAQARGDGEDRSIEAVLGMKGAFGTIAKLGKAPSEYAAALDVAAGGRLRNVVVENDDIASKAIAYLKENKLGRVTFLPLNKLRPPSLPAVRDEGVIDYAVNLLDFDPQFEPAFRLVFGQTVIVDTLAHARKLIGKHRMVTVDGELLEKTGAMTGGYLKKRSGFGVAAKDEISRLSAALGTAQAEAGECEQLIARLSAEGDEKRKKRAGFDEQIARYRIQIEEYSRIVDTATTEQKEIAAVLAGMQDEAGGGAGKLAGIEEALEGIGKELNRLTADSEAQKRLLDDTTVPALIEGLERSKKEIEEKERRLRNKEADIVDAQRERQFFSKRVEELGTERQQTAAKVQKCDADSAASQSEIAANRKLVAELEERQKEFSSELEGLRKRRDAILSAIQSIERTIADYNTAAERLKLQIAALQERESGLSTEVDALRLQAGDASTDLSLEEVEKRIGELEQAIKALGAVNMLAVGEYERISSRIAERTEKKEVLSRERTTLMERIEKFERMKFDSFMTAYSAIDANFREIFARLTSGSGHLVLENEEDPFAGGLTFAVQPRDKKVHLLSALSGGEKSLTTLSFIFSIQKYMPAPFYALDEVDMFLDGSNVERIANMIKDLSGNAQSVIVSLRKPMIEKADRIIGVTLRPDKSTLVTGVSMNG